MLHTEDLKTVSRIGKALWINPKESERSTIDALSAVTLLKLSPERTLERTSRALLERAKVHRSQAKDFGSLLTALNHPFFRLAPEERLILTSLHVGRWPYARLGRILGFSAEQVEKMAWAARLRMHADSPQRATGANLVYPSGPVEKGTSCPDYDPEIPWTQRFLDQEIKSNRERLFLQNHLLTCPPCADALSRCRQVYYQVDRDLTVLMDELEGNEGTDHLRSLKASVEASPEYQYPSERTFLQTLRIFTRRKDVFWLGMFLSSLIAIQVVLKFLR